MMIKRAIDAARSFLPAGDVASLHPFGSGHIQQTFAVETPTGRRLLQRINTLVFPDVDALMDNIARVSGHVQKGPLKPLRLMPSNDGRWYARDAQGDCWRMFEFIENTRAFEATSGIRRVTGAAQAFGLFASALRDLPPPRLHEVIPGFHLTPRRFELLGQAVSDDRRARAALATNEIDMIMRRHPFAEELSHRELPERVVHNDAKLSNILFDVVTDEAVSVVDWDTVMPGLIVHDYGDMIRSMTTDAAEDEVDLAKVHVREDLFEAVTDGYLSATAGWLTVAEKGSLLLGGKTIVFEQAMRFLTDFLAGDVYYAVKHPRHNLDRCRTQLAMLRSIEHNEGSLQRIIDSCIERHSGRSDFQGSSCE